MPRRIILRTRLERIPLRGAYDSLSTRPEQDRLGGFVGLSLYESRVGSRGALVGLSRFKGRAQYFNSRLAAYYVGPPKS